MGNIRGTHSSPGIYTKFTDISYAANTLGITSLGLVGETLKGAAFEPMLVTSWTQYVDYYGGTSPELYKGSKYPRYELPYIAKEYLKKADRLYVSRVLGFSGYNAGPLFAITVGESGDTEGTLATGKKKQIIAVLRSKASYDFYSSGDTCNNMNKSERITFLCSNIKVSKAQKANVTYHCGVISETGGTTSEDITLEVSNTDFGTCKLEYTGVTNNITGSVKVSFDPDSNDYILKVIGTSTEYRSESDFPFYVEEFYDNFYYDFLSKNCSGTTKYNIISDETKIGDIEDKCDIGFEASDFVRVKQDNISPTMIGKIYLCDSVNVVGDKGTYKYNNGTSDVDMQVGKFYIVSEKNGVYQYVAYAIDNSAQTLTTGQTVYVISDNHYYTLNSAGNVDLITNLWDYREEYRCASTPWILSEAMGNGKTVKAKKLFRLHTVSDGECANTQIKISFSNLDYDNKTFDMIIRDFNDSDVSPIVLENYKNVNLIEGDKHFLGLKVGTTNGEYERKSKYVTVEFSDEDIVDSIPCGFLGYPVRTYTSNHTQPSISYKTTVPYNENARKTYFGISDMAGIDVDLFKYKGAHAYYERKIDIASGTTNGFHMDYRMGGLLTGSTIYVSDIQVPEKYFSIPNGGDKGSVIGTESDMEGTLFENKKLRKFTVCPCGGFDGWDIFRESRTNTDKYNTNKYKLYNNSGVTSTGTTTYNTDVFKQILTPEAYGLSGKCITSDYYAFLAGAHMFENPELYPINILATPGIDYVNNLSLTEDILDMVEFSRGDSIYIMTTPDKPFGEDDSITAMYTASDAVDNLESSEIDTYYAATYYPWIKYYDNENHKYIMLPATKDVVRNMADVDNKKFPWYTPAGTERGVVNCVKTHIFSKLEMEDDLYDGRINPIKTFAKDGIKIWGNKTMYTGDTPMNRINTVRLMLYIKKLIIEACRPFIFEPNDTILKGQFEKTLKSILEQVQKDRGITSFKVKVSQTPEEMDAHEMNGQVFVKPVEALEYIGLEFVVTPNGVDFEIV